MNPFAKMLVDRGLDLAVALVKGAWKPVDRFLHAPRPKRPVVPPITDEDLGREDATPTAKHRRPSR